jgi:hypothetical protein
MQLIGDLQDLLYDIFRLEQIVVLTLRGVGLSSSLSFHQTRSLQDRCSSAIPALMRIE